MSDTKVTAESPKNLYQRIAAVMQDVQYLNKDKKVGDGTYSYQGVSEETVISNIRTAMITHGLVIMPHAQHHTLTDYVRPKGVTSISSVDVTYKLVNVDDPNQFELIVSSGTGVDNQDKGVGKAMTYALKYALLRTFMIPTGNDADRVHNKELEAQQEAELQGAISKAIAGLPNQKSEAELTVYAQQQHEAVKTAPRFREAWATAKQALPPQPAHANPLA